jgi:GcrA cell cycle regulator
MRGEAWSSERIEVLRSLWRQGLTADVIGARLGGLSRSAVLGKVFRLRLRDSSGDGVPSAPQKSPASRCTADSAGPARRRRRQPRAASATLPVVISQHKTLLELTNHSCRWPHGRPGTAKFFFCGALGADLAQGLPYCPRHMRRAYRPSGRVEKAGPIAAGPRKSAPRKSTPGIAA